MTETLHQVLEFKIIRLAIFYRDLEQVAVLRIAGAALTRCPDASGAAVRHRAPRLARPLTLGTTAAGDVQYTSKSDSELIRKPPRPTTAESPTGTSNLSLGASE